MAERSKVKLYNELGLETLEDSTGNRAAVYDFQIQMSKVPTQNYSDFC